MFATDALILQLSYALLIAAVVTSERRVTRALIGLSAGFALIHALFWARDTTTIVWMALLLLACAILLVRDLLRDADVRFTPEEDAMRLKVLPGISRTDARRLIDQGLWLAGDEGDRLTEEAKPVDHVVYLSAGEAQVLVGGRHIATCGAGDLIGEVTILSGEAATATVVLAGPARFWCAPAAALRAYLDANPRTRLALERSFSKSLKAKLVASNKVLAGAAEQLA